MDRLTERLDLGFDEWEQIAFKTPDDEQGLYNIVDVVEHRDEEWARQILLSLAETVADYEDTGLTPEQIREINDFFNSQTAKILAELQEYQREEENGLLLRLPCKIGNTIFVVPSKVNYKLNVLNGYKENNKVYEQKVHEIRLFSNERYLLSTCDGICSVLSDACGETWFLTKGEAEARLAEMEGKV